MITSWTAILGCGDVSVANPGPPCTSPAQCDDLNACTTDTCERGFCLRKPVPDGDSAVQTPGDCWKFVCKGGVEQPAIDSTDAADDGNDCTLDTCTAGGTPEHTAVTQNTPCMYGGYPGFCDGFDKCLANECFPHPGFCDDALPCTADTCNVATGKCDFIPLDDGVLTPGFQVSGDCQVHQCVMGSDTSVVDDTDLPVSANDCVIPTCTAGVPSQPPATLGTACKTNNGKVCDGSGSCVVCNVDADCIAPQTCTGNPKTCQ